MSVCVSVSTITQVFFIRSSPNLVGSLIYEYGRSLFNDVMMTSSPRSRATGFYKKIAYFWLVNTITQSFFIRSSPNLVWMMECGWGRTPYHDVMMTSSPRLRSTDYGRKFCMFTFRGVFDPFTVEIGEIWPRLSRKRIISAFRRAWPHVKIPTRTEVTAGNVCAFQLFLVCF